MASGPERRGWRVNVETLGRIEAFGVLIAPCGELWRARVLTYPNVLWLVPGGNGTMKFVGRTAGEAEREAKRFIRRYCQARGFRMRDDLEDEQGSWPCGADRREKPAVRKIRFLPVRFGLAGPTELGGTGNLSETGLFIITDAPLDSGKRVTMALETEQSRLQLKGWVRWMRKEHHLGGSPGMGIQLDSPPTPYIEYVRSLG